jgi:hypothetical protein
MTPTDTLITFGSEVKAMPDGKVGGYLVLFGSPSKTDLTSKRDYFTPETDFGLDLATKSRAIYDHGLDATVGKLPIGIVELKADVKGIWAEGQIKARDDYEAMVKAIIGKDIPELIAAKKLGWSSGTAAHLVERVEQPNGSHWIKSWPLGLDASLTPTPCEPRTLAVSLKSLIAERLLNGDATKGKHLGEHSGRYAAMAAVEHLHGQLSMRVGDAMRDQKSTMAAKCRAIKGAHAECGESSIQAMKALMLPTAGDGAENDDYGTKGLLGPRVEIGAAMAALDSLHSRLTNALWSIVGDEDRPPKGRMADVEAAIKEFRDAAMGLVAPMLMGPAETAAKKALDDARMYDRLLMIDDRLRGLDLGD